MGKLRGATVEAKSGVVQISQQQHRKISGEFSAQVQN